MWTTPGSGGLAWLVELGHRRDLLVDLPSCAAFVGGRPPTRLRPALNSQLRTGTDQGNPTV